MVVAKFSENFWGEKINGFDILCQNLKHSLNNVKDLETYFRECENIEDTYTKLLSRLSTQMNRYSTNGTFYPVWSPMKELNERLASTHTQIMHQIRDIIKETQRYYDDLNKKLKRIRDNESQTQLSVQNFQEITQLLNKTKEQYHNSALELEKQKRAENTNVQRLEKKVKQSFDEYKTNVDRYNLTRNEYERKFTDSCTHLQLAEELHLKQIKQLVDNYTKIFLNNNQTIKQIYDEFHVKIESFSNDVLIQLFIDNKRTGSDRPEAVSIIEPDFSKLPATTTTTTSQQFSANISSNSSNSGGNNSINNYNSFNDNDFNLFLNPNIPVPINDVKNSPFNGTATNGSMQHLMNSTTGINVTSSSSSTSSTSAENMKRSDSRGLNIFNIDILSRNKSKDKKAQKASTKIKKKTELPAIQQQPDLIQINVKDTNSVNSDELTSIASESLTINSNTLRRSTNNINVSSSLDLFDQLNKNSNGSDVDSEGYSIRPDYKGDNKKDNEDMNNFYKSSATESDSDSEPEIGVGPTKVMLKIKPKTEVEENLNENSEVLREVSKNLQLKTLSSLQQQQQLGGGIAAGGGLQQKKRTYFSFGTLANTNQQVEQTANWPNAPMSRSISFAGSNQPTPDLGFNTNDFSKATNIVPTQLKTPTDANLYNIEEDKEVESSFQLTNKRNSQLIMSSNNFSLPPPNSAPSIPGRFTPACFPGRTTPNFQHSTSLLENNNNQRAVPSPLTVNGNDSIIPLAVQFNETIHAYFKLTDTNKFKLKCTGCMKISFPYAILKFLVNELPQLEFRLSNLHLTSQDLIINEQLLVKNEQHFQFNTSNLVKELLDQHQQNKQAAFFNFELLKYDLKTLNKPPLFLNATWKLHQIDFNNIELEFNLEYSHQHSKQLSNLNFMLVLSQQANVYKISNIDSSPQALMQDNDQKLQVLWNMPSLSSRSTENLNAKFNLLVVNKNEFKITNALDSICTQPLFVKFHMDNDTLSQVKFEILSANYRLSLLREKIESGKYFCTPSLVLINQTLDGVYEQICGDMGMDMGSSGSSGGDKTPTAGSISTQIGSSVDVLLNY